MVQQAKDLVVSLLWLRSLLWQSLARELHMLWLQPKKKKGKKGPFKQPSTPTQYVQCQNPAADLKHGANSGIFSLSDLSQHKQ